MGTLNSYLIKYFTVNHIRIYLLICKIIIRNTKLNYPEDESNQNLLSLVQSQAP